MLFIKFKIILITPYSLVNYILNFFSQLDDHSNWVLEESPPFLTCEEVEALRNDLANMPIQSTLDDINMFLYNISIYKVPLMYLY